MSSQDTNFLNPNDQMISARKAAKRLGFSQDYVGKLCSEGKLEGKLVDNAWFVSEASLIAFEVKNTKSKQERSEELSELRRKENKIFREARGLPEIESTPQGLPVIVPPKVSLFARPFL